jgi:starvation-inducible DNA-binding protein
MYRANRVRFNMNHFILKGAKMPRSANTVTIHPAAAALPEAENKSFKTVKVLEELLARSIHLRDLYKSARWQTANMEYRPLRQVLDGHYREQIHLVDTLIDRIRALGGAHKVFARNFIQHDQLSRIFRGRTSITALLSELIDAHDAVLSMARPAAANDGQADHSWLGQVVLTNDLQMRAISKQLMDRERRLHTHATWVTMLDPWAAGN